MQHVINHLTKFKFENLKLEQHEDQIVVRRTGLRQPEAIVAVIMPFKNTINVYYHFQQLNIIELKCKFISNVRFKKVDSFLEKLFLELSKSSKSTNLRSWDSSELRVESIPSQFADLYTSVLDQEVFG